MKRYHRHLRCGEHYECLRPADFGKGVHADCRRRHESACKVSDAIRCGFCLSIIDLEDEEHESSSCYQGHPRLTDSIYVCKSCFNSPPCGNPRQRCMCPYTCKIHTEQPCPVLPKRKITTCRNCLLDRRGEYTARKIKRQKVSSGRLSFEKAMGLPRFATVKTEGWFEEISWNTFPYELWDAIWKYVVQDGSRNVKAYKYLTAREQNTFRMLGERTGIIIMTNQFKNMRLSPAEMACEAYRFLYKNRRFVRKYALKKEGNVGKVTELTQLDLTQIRWRKIYTYDDKK